MIRSNNPRTAENTDLRIKTGKGKKVLLTIFITDYDYVISEELSRISAEK